MEPLYRSAADGALDNEEAVRNLLDGYYVQWPNDAGFDGLDEVRGPVDIPVTGTIPPWVAGSLYRTGPGQLKVEGPNGTHNISHWFDGLAHTHRFEIVPTGDGSTKVSYWSRRQSEARYKYIQEHGMKDLRTFAQRQDPCVGMYTKLTSTFQPAATDSADSDASSPPDEILNIAVTVQANMPGLPKTGGQQASGHRAGVPKTVWALTDNHTMKEMDPVTLEPFGVAKQDAFHPDLKGPLSCAHAERDPATGDFFNFNCEVGQQGAVYRLFRVDAANGETEILATIRGAPAAYIHSFYLSGDHAVLCVPSSHFGEHGARLATASSVLDAIEEFDPPRQRWRWYVADRRRGRGLVAQFESDAGFFFHTVNAFEETDEENGGVSIICDVMEFADLGILRALYYDALLGDKEARAWIGQGDSARGTIPRHARYRLRLPPPVTSDDKPSGDPPAVAQAERVFTRLGPHAGELPTINHAFHTRRHRYVYSLAFRGLSTFADTIVKADADTGAAVLWNNPKGHSPGEAIFVARPASAGGTGDEDDGALLSVVLDGAKGRSYLLCLDARTMREMGRAEMDFAVAFGFHGMHTPLGLGAEDGEGGKGKPVI